ncbi:unnamed protein product [Camellia sinensis]
MYRYRPASPTTLGKEIAIFAVRLSRERRDISQVEIMGKFAGVVRNYNAHLVAYPDIKWRQIAEEFMKSLGLSFNPCVTLIIKSVLDPYSKVLMEVWLVVKTVMLGNQQWRFLKKG